MFIYLNAFLPFGGSVNIRRVLFALTVLLYACSATAEDGLTAWQTTAIVAEYPLAIHQLPITAFHESSHWLTARILGDRPGLWLLPRYITNGDGTKSLTVGSVTRYKKLSGVKEVLVYLAPYIVQVGVVDRGAEWAYRRGYIRTDTFADKYTQNVLALNTTAPIESALFSKHGDFGQIAAHTHVPRIILGAVVQTAYIFSYNRVIKARGHQNDTWVFYVHKTF